MLGGAAGAALRYAMGLVCSHFRVLSMPVGTLTVNLIGCLLLGILMGIGDRYTAVPHPVLLMLTVGLCGRLLRFPLSLLKPSVRWRMDSGGRLSRMFLLVWQEAYSCFG